MSSHAPKLIAPTASIVLIKGYRMSPIALKNEGEAVMTCQVEPNLPVGLSLLIENQTVMVTGAPLALSAKTQYVIIAEGENGKNCEITLEITVQEALSREQRGEILSHHDSRGDLDTPRSQLADAVSDQFGLGSNIKPHEKFINQPAGDDKRLSANANTNPDAEQRAQSSPELTPSPSAQLQQQAIAAANPNITPSPTR